MADPVPWPNDPDTPLVITCAHCGKVIGFKWLDPADKVYVNGPSYVCRDHAETKIQPAL